MVIIMIMTVVVVFVVVVVVVVAAAAAAEIVLIPMYVRCLLVDFSKAFGVVNRQISLDKLT